METRSQSIRAEQAKECTVIVSGSYRPEYSYQENIWAEHLVRRGHTVVVITARVSDEVPYDIHGYRVIPVRTRGIQSRHLYYESTVGYTVAKLNPTRILWFGPPQLFGRSVLAHPALEHIPMAIFMGQNRHMHAFDWTEAGLGIYQRFMALTYRVIRGGTIVAACRRAQLIVASTPETPHILEMFFAKTVWSSVKHKILKCPLGFDENTFFVDEVAQRQTRSRLGISLDSTTLLLTSRFSSEKWSVISLIYGAFEDILARFDDVHCLIVGLDDKELSQRMRTLVDGCYYRDRIHLEPFRNREGLAHLMNTADIVVFGRPSISCQEALGTGAYGVFADDGTMDWLVANEDDGSFFQVANGDDLVSTLAQAIEKCTLNERLAEARRARSQRALRFSYGQIIDLVMSTLHRSTSS